MSLKQKLYFLVGGLFYHKYVHRLLPVRCYLKVRWHQTMGGELDLYNPKTFNEKLQWLKINDRNPLYPTLVDKYEVKQWVAEKIGNEYVIPTLGLYDSVEQINFDELPDKFVLKCTHDSGSTLVCKDKKTFDIKAASKLLSERMTYNYYWNAREWPYRGLKHRIIAEPYLCDEKSYNALGLTDYKFTCFNGSADNVMVCAGRDSGNTEFFFFNKEWHLLPYNVRGSQMENSFTLPRPACMDTMFELACALSEQFPFVRVDMYAVNDRPYFGEMTFYPCGGFDPNLLTTTDKMFGERIDLNLAHGCSLTNNRL